MKREPKIIVIDPGSDPEIQRQVEQLEQNMASSELLSRLKGIFTLGARKPLSDRPTFLIEKKTTTTTK